MKSEIAKLWTDALRSGEYAQSQERLRKGNSYCCLGVLCDLYRKETGEGDWDNEFVENESYKTFVCSNERGGKQSMTLPYPVRDWAGLKVHPTEWNRDTSNDYRVLISLNDQECYSFSQIADFIEENKETL